MKKSIVALSAVAALGGLGFAGLAHAVAYVGPGTLRADPAAPAIAVADGVELNAGGVGHFLFVPYYSAQDGMSSMFNITNSDMTNGKAVKVRFRGAANSDDVLDFTVYLSPGDVWAATVEGGANGGPARLSTTDKSCTLPAIPAAGVPFSTGRLASYMDTAQKNVHTREGYIEILNMADIPPNYAGGAKAGTTNALYTNIKHNAAGVPPCLSAAFDAVQSLPAGAALNSVAEAEAAGLSNATGGLFGSFGVVNQSKFALYGGAHTAIQAKTAAGAAGVSGQANIAFAPQREEISSLPAVELAKLTADPLLRGASPFIAAQWYDLPDMSTPLVGAPGAGLALQQVARLSAAMSKGAIMNDFSVSNGAVPMNTDWIVSQPTRRYHVAVDYGSALSAAQRVWNPVVTNAVAADAEPVLTAPVAASPENNVYRSVSLSRTANMGPYACLAAGLGMTNREESGANAAFSPGSPLSFCGEVFTLSFGGESSVVNAKVGNTTSGALPGETGWARLSLGSGVATPLPVVGFAATSAINTTTKGNFGLTLPHRW